MEGEDASGAGEASAPPEVVDDSPDNEQQEEDEENPLADSNAFSPSGKEKKKKRKKDKKKKDKKKDKKRKKNEKQRKEKKKRRKLEAQGEAASSHELGGSAGALQALPLRVGIAPGHIVRKMGHQPNALVEMGVSYLHLSI